MEAPHEDIAATRPPMAQYTEDDHVPPPLWQSVVRAFRHAQLRRLEARAERLRRRTRCAPTVNEQHMLLIPANPHQSADTGWSSVSMTRPHRPWLFTSVICLSALVSITLSVSFLHNHERRAAALFPPAADVHARDLSQETTELRTLLTSLDDRVTLLHHQVLQQGDQLTNQTATVLGVTQHADTRQIHVTALADALAVLTSQVAHIEQQMASHTTRLAAHEQQRVLQSMQLEPVQPQTKRLGRGGVKTTGRSHRTRPPMLEVFALSASPTASPVPHMPPSPSAVGVPPTRRSITLPAALGVEGYRAATATTEGTRP